MTYVTDRYNIICETDTESVTLTDVTEYSETTEFVYLRSVTKYTLIKRGWRGDVMVSYILANTKNHTQTTSTEYCWSDVILIRVMPTPDRDWMYVFAK